MHVCIHAPESVARAALIQTRSMLLGESPVEINCGNGRGLGRPSVAVLSDVPGLVRGGFPSRSAPRSQGRSDDGDNAI